MNVWLRTLLTISRARRALRRRGPVSMTSVGRIRLRVLPTDIDLLRHLNNGRYLSLFDLGRWDLLVRSGLLDAMGGQGWYPVVASETVSFRKSLHLWQRFTVETRFVAQDDRAVYLEHRAVVGGEIYAQAFIRARVLRRGGGVVGYEELAAAVGSPDDLSGVPTWIHDWSVASALPSTRDAAPSDWPETAGW